MRFRRALTWAACLLAWLEATELHGTTGAGDSASAGAGARTAPSRRRQRRAGRLRADSGMAGTNARPTSGEDGGVRRRDCRRRTRRRVLLQFSSRRPDHRRRAAGPHQDRRQGRQGLGAARRACRPTLCSRRAGPVRRQARSGVRHEPHDLSRPTPCCRTAANPGRAAAQPRRRASPRARSSRRTTSGSRT